MITNIKFKEGQRFAIDKKVYALNQTMTIGVELCRCYLDGEEIDLRDYATYVEPFDEDAWYKKMDGRGFHFKNRIGLIFF